MEDSITPVSIANAIMQDTSYANHYLLVEGVKDSKLYGKFFDKNLVRIRETFGCEKLRECKTILNKRGYENCFGIVDRDFHEILGTLPVEDDLFVVDMHDIEILMVNSSALDHILSIYTTSEKIINFETTVKKNLKELLFELSNQIGFLKLANKVHDLGLVFKPKETDGNQIAYNKFISDKLDFLGMEKMIDKIIDYSRNKSDNIKNRDYILEKYKEIAANKYDKNHLSNGHDITNILFIFLKKSVRSTNKMLFDFNSIEDSLILAYDTNEFQKTDLYRDIKNFFDSKGIDLFIK